LHLRLRAGLSCSCSIPFSCPSGPQALLSFPTRRSSDLAPQLCGLLFQRRDQPGTVELGDIVVEAGLPAALDRRRRHHRRQRDDISEEHTSELQSREKLVGRLLLEKKKEGVRG